MRYADELRTLGPTTCEICGRPYESHDYADARRLGWLYYKQGGYWRLLCGRCDSERWTPDRRGEE